MIGGKPLFDFSFSIPITFELTVLFSAFASVHRHVRFERAAAAVSSVVQLSATRIAPATTAFCW